MPAQVPAGYIPQVRKQRTHAGLGLCIAQRVLNAPTLLPHRVERLNLYTPQGLPVVGNPIARGEVVADSQSRQTQQRGWGHPQNPPHTAILVPHPPVCNGLLAVRREGVDWNLPDPDSRMTVETVEDVRGVLCNTRRLRTAAMPRRPYLLSNSGVYERIRQWLAM